MILLPLLCLLAWGIAFHRRGRDRLDAAVAALVVVGLSIAVIPEFQSLTGTLTPAGSAAAWGVVATIGLLLVRRAPPPAPASPNAGRPTGWEFLIPVALFLALTAAVALLSAPNSFDALSYHLVRVERWIQQGSLHPYPTHDTRQLFMPSWAEYGVLQFRLLSGGDRFSNLVQWLGYAGACGGAALLARGLGGGRVAQTLAAGLVATLPMAIAQASGSQTDDAAACWAAIAAAYGWQLLAPAPRRGNLVLSAIALGLAAATKQTALLFGAAALLPVLLGLVRQRNWRWLGGSVVAGAAAVLLLAGPQWYRTWSVFGNLSGDPFWTAMASATARGPAQVVSGVVRNLALHFGTPWVAVNQWVAGAASTISSAVGADPNDPRTTWWSGFGPTGFNTHEDTARNPLHLLLLLVCTLGLTRGAGRRHRLGFVLALAAAFVVFSTVLKWQPYHSRLQTPLFALGLAWAAVELERIPRGGSRVVLLLLSLAALPQALLNYTRPLIALPGHPLTPRPRIGSLPRALQYFMIWPHLANPFIDVSLKIAESSCSDVGVRDFGDAWDYPVMALVREAGSPAKFRSVNVTNLSARLAPPAAPPCLLLQIGSDAGSPPRWAAGWRVLADWRPLLGMGGVVLFGPER